ncbi:MAG: hypothetical protein IPM47_01555 [Sphingobacteriales bacterium]|nr:MAG: hypothetical protein IPM47_01555 [Sphingobacteriales bacterium]
MKPLLVLLVLLAYCSTTQAQKQNEVTLLASYRSTYTDLPANNSTNGIAKIHDLNYRVLLGVFTHRIPIEADYWEAVRSDLSVIQNEDNITYTVGCYKSYTEAERKCLELIRKGYQYATVAAFSADNPLNKVLP